MLSFKNFINESNLVKINGKSVNMTLPSKSKGYKLVTIITSKFDDAFKKDTEYYIGKGGIGSIKGRYKGFELFVLGGLEELAPGVVIHHTATDTIEASEVTVDKNGIVSFINGRHRYAWLRDHNVNDIQVAMDNQSIVNAKQYGLIK